MSPRTRMPALALVGLAAALAPAGCGGGGGSHGTGTSGTAPGRTATAPTPARTATTAAGGPATAGGKVDLPKRYTAVVADVQRRLDALTRKVPSASEFGSARFGSASRDVARDVRVVAGELRAARPPYAVRALHASVLHRLGTIEDDFVTLAGANDAGDLDAASGALSGISGALAGVQSDIRRIKARVK